MNRIDRVTAILIQLQSRRVVKAQDIAHRFGISLRTVYRDVKTLEEAGVPIIGEAGVGYSIMEGYRLPPVMFTREEATAFLTAEKFIEQFTDPFTQASYKSAMFKVRAVLRSAEKSMLEDIEARIAVLRPYTSFGSVSADNVLQPLMRSIADKKAVRLHYQSASADVTERVVEPVGVFYANTTWHLIAFCRLRNDYRNFRVDRIIGLAATDEAFAVQHPLLEEYLRKTVAERELQQVVIRLPIALASYLERQRYSYGFVSERRVGSDMEMSFLSGSLSGFARWFMMFADVGHIVKPDALLDEVRTLFEKISTKI